MLNTFDTSSSNSDLHSFKVNFEIESRKLAAEIVGGERRGGYVCSVGTVGRAFIMKLRYSSTHYQVTQHHMNVGTVPHITR
jgi:hypothetical protein